MSCSQHFATVSYPDLHKSSPHISTLIYLRSILVSSTSLFSFHIDVCSLNMNEGEFRQTLASMGR
jgi:hypothetical protein